MNLNSTCKNVCGQIQPHSNSPWRNSGFLLAYVCARLEILCPNGGKTSLGEKKKRSDQCLVPSPASGQHLLWYDILDCIISNYETFAYQVECEKYISFPKCSGNQVLTFSGGLHCWGFRLPFSKSTAVLLTGISILKLSQQTLLRHFFPTSS